MGQKLCPNLLIKNKRIILLINRKPGKNQYNNTINNTENTDQQDNQQALSIYNNHKLTIQRAPHSKEDQLNKPAKSNRDHQSNSRGSFQEMTLFFLLLLRDFSTTRCKASHQPTGSHPSSDCWQGLCKDEIEIFMSSVQR
jgi:hypothetical protein